MLKPLLMAATAAGFLAACATPQPQPDVAARATEASPRANCLTTGTRITLKPGECANASGRVYSKDDLDSTGAFTPAEALRRLDPAFTR